MCTAVFTNLGCRIAGFNLDILNMQYRVTPSDERVTIDILDATEGWMPLFGANQRGDFVAMPTCWPHDPQSNPTENRAQNVICLDIDVLFQRKCLEDVAALAEKDAICSVPDLTFQAQLSNAAGDVLQVVPGQGYRCLKAPRYSVMTNFSPYKMNRETHPWMGWERYGTAVEMLEAVSGAFGVDDCFRVLDAVAQTVCPTEVSMVFDVDARKVYWKFPRQADAAIHSRQLIRR